METGNFVARMEDLSCEFKILCAHTRSRENLSVHVLHMQYFVNKTFCVHFVNFGCTGKCIL